MRIDRRQSSNPREYGGIAAPALLWMLGVPGFLVILLWFFFFRG